MLKQKKLSAADRTVDMFTGKTKVDVNLLEDDEKEVVRIPETIEQSAERWRANAIFTTEHLSKSFNNGEPGDEVFRITRKDDNLFLEKFVRDNSGKEYYHWTGVMFRDDSLYEITNVFVKAAKHKRDMERLGSQATETELKEQEISNGK